MTAARNLSHFVRHLDGGVARMELEVEGLNRAGCTQTIEGGLAAIPDITLARVNVAERRVAVEWREGKVDPVRFVNRLSELGYRAHPCGAWTEAEQLSWWTLLRCLCVAASAVAVITLLPAIAWPDAAAEITFGQHSVVAWLSAVIALAATVWAGRPFFIAATRAMAKGRLSPEAPVSAGIALAFGLSVSETLNHAGGASYDLGLMLLVLSLAVRMLEPGLLQQSVPEAAGSAAPGEETVTKFISGAELADVPVGSVRPGDVVLVRPGQRIAVDGVVTEGRSTIDQSRITGETLPVPAARDTIVRAGILNLSGTLRVRAIAVEAAAPPDAAGSLSGRAAGGLRFSRHAARFYPLLAFAIALIAFVDRAAAGSGWHEATAAAVAVLMLAHPTVFNLAASIVEARAARALSRAGVLLKSGDSIARFARVDTVVFDKTATLTLPDAEVVNAADIPPDRLAVAGRLALASRHPLAAAVARTAAAKAPIIALEEPGQGVRSIFNGVPVRLGRPSFCAAERCAAAILETDPEASVIAFAYGAERHVLAVRQRLRNDAIETVARLKQDGFAVEIASGDRAPAVAHAARTLGIERWHAGMTAADKVGHISVLQAQGRTVMVVGDGLNDAPALAAADAALSVGTASPSAITAADGILAGSGLAPAAAAIAIARRARRLARGNICMVIAAATAMAFAAIAGVSSPFAAALAMSSLAVLLTLNALRIGADPAGIQKR